jgi:hypothetical protein
MTFSRTTDASSTDIVAPNVNTFLLSLLPERKSHFLGVLEIDTCFGWNVPSVQRSDASYALANVER